MNSHSDVGEIGRSPDLIARAAPSALEVRTTYTRWETREIQPRRTPSGILRVRKRAKIRGAGTKRIYLHPGILGRKVRARTLGVQLRTPDANYELRSLLPIIKLGTVQPSQLGFCTRVQKEIKGGLSPPRVNCSIERWRDRSPRCRVIFRPRR